jgi:zinc protease
MRNLAMHRQKRIAFLVSRAALGASFLLLFAWAPAPAHAVEVQRVVSPGGIEAWLVEDHSNPIISLDLAFRGGSIADPQGQEGLANMVASLIDEGAGDLDSQAFQGVLEDNSISLRFNTGTDNFNGALVTLTENRDLAFKMLRLALSEPRFDAEPVERIRAQILAGLARSAEDPDAIAYRTLRTLHFPAHPYGRESDGTMESVAGITPAQMRDFVARRFARDNLILGVVGDIAPAELSVLLDKTFDHLPARAEPVEVAEAKPQGEGSVVVIERDQPQSIVAFGHGGIKRDDPDYYAAYVVNHIMGGGGFSSRLYAEIREKRGLAYSVYAYLNPLEHSALVMGGVATQNSRVSTTLDLVRAEWRRMAEEGPSAEELDAAKTFLTGSYPLRFSSSGRIANMLTGMQIENLGIDYIDRRNSFIEAVTLEDARRVARRLYDADALSVVVVGRPEGVVANREAPRS